MLAFPGNRQGGPQGQVDRTSGEEETEKSTDLEEAGKETDEGSGEETELEEDGREKWADGAGSYEATAWGNSEVAR